MVARTIPTTDAGGHPAGLLANCAAVHAFCSVVSLAGRIFGSSTLTRAMFASLPTEPAGSETFASRLAPSALLVRPLVDTVKPGLNARLLQPVAANGLLTLAVACWEPEIVAVICCWLQLVG